MRPDANANANGDSGVPEYEVFAIRYASVERRAADNFLMPGPQDPHDGPMALDFYYWVIRGHGRVVLVDTGFSAASARQRNRTLDVTPEQALARLGLDCGDVTDVVLTHLHYDHAGNIDAFPDAVIHVQDAEMQYATGRYMCFHALRHFFSVDDVAALLRKVYQDRVRFHEGDVELAPGIGLFRVGGHTPGLQVVRAATARGRVVLASDALHYYRNYSETNPFPAIFHVGEMLEGYRKIAALADSDDHIVPGHDPLVARRYPPLDAGAGTVFRLDRTPAPMPVALPGHATNDNTH
jgi:glyoxylase-like metal-dependent hydrolase (beta-lactamase superfamily II)